mmetsp:Transcript_15991/g.37699  ORF Transcript_15991/g.37699 Transcript_15991/m.37699 type:complete len:366 (-) Transcript_15991:73-1170(-)
MSFRFGCVCCIAAVLGTTALKVAPSSGGTLSKAAAPTADFLSLDTGLAALVGDYNVGCIASDVAMSADQERILLAQRQASVKPKAHETEFSQKGAAAQEEMSQGSGRSPAFGRKPVLWIHLHNFAGTYMCKEAAKQNEFGAPGQNCLLEWDRCSTQEQEKRVHCDERVSMALTNSFSMIERDVEDLDFCEDVLTGIMLRDPIHAAQSTLRNNKFDKESLMKVLHSKEEGPIPHKRCLPPWDSYQHFDNFAVRTLGGAYNVPPGGVTKKHYLQAQRRLLNMDVVMILEELTDHMPQLERMLGWNTTLMTPSQPRNSHCGGDMPSWTVEEKIFLTLLNKWDYRLYALGRRLAARHTRDAMNASGSPW